MTSLLMVLGLGAVDPASLDGVRLAGRWFEAPVRRAVRAAADRLADPACARLLASFHDGSGRPLAARLDRLSLDAPSYARTVLFYDGSDERPCRKPRVHAFTVPGSRVVRVCPELGRAALSEPSFAEAVVIHELLHTLGLPESPPTSESITAAVEKHCGL
ncbi:MAG TPA: hypothetical protein VFM88_10415 [Vicinamibacteria bacterium]|nr:hypothetical protein [Vicinamibacteria bacterium]